MTEVQQDADALFEQLMKNLPADYEDKAREFKAFARARKVRSVLQLMRIVLLYCGLDKTLREVAANFGTVYEPIGDSAIAGRLAACAPWIRAMLSQMLGTRDIVESQGTSVLRIVAADATTVQAPGAKGTDYRLHLALDLVKMDIIFVEITDKHGGETLDRFEVREGDLVLGDRGYCHPKAMKKAVDKGAHLVIRLNSGSVCLRHPDGSRLDLLKTLGIDQDIDRLTIPVQVTGSDGSDCIEAWIHAHRLPEEIANEKRRKLRQQYTKKGKAPLQQTLDLCSWVLVLTTVPPEQMSAQTILALYRVRWQIELTIKRLKSVLNLDRLRARAGATLAEVWLHGKMLYALLIDRRLRGRMNVQWAWLDRVRPATLWRVTKMIAEELRPIVTASHLWCPEKLEKAIPALFERPRKRKLQELPHEVLRFQSTATAQSYTCGLPQNGA